MKNKLGQNKSTEKQKKQKVKDLFSKVTTGGASVATVIVVTATSFFIPNFEVETFSDRIYYEAIVEPLDIPEYPEDVDPNDPNVEIVYEEPELRIRLSSQFGELYQDLDLFENEGVFEALMPNTPYELTIQHYNGYSWVNLDQIAVRTKVENKASILKVEEAPDFKSLSRQLSIKVMAEADLEMVQAMRLYVEGDTVHVYELQSGESRIDLILERQDEINMWIEYDIQTVLEDETIMLNTVVMTEMTYQMLPYIPYRYQLDYTKEAIEFSLSSSFTGDVTYYVVANDGNFKIRYDQVTSLESIDIINHKPRMLEIYADIDGYEAPFMLESIDLDVFRDFVYIATVNDGKLILTIIDPDNRIESLTFIQEGKVENYAPTTKDNVLLYEIFLDTRFGYEVELTLNNDVASKYVLIKIGD